MAHRVCTFVYYMLAVHESVRYWTALTLEASSNLSGRLPLHVACFFVHAWRVCDVSETSDGSTARVRCQAWMVHHSTLAIHELAAGSLVSGICSIHQSVAACLRLELVQRRKPWLSDLSYVAKLRRTSGCSFKLTCSECGSAA